MSDLLSELPHYGLDRHNSIVTVDTGQPGALLAAADVREALTNPTPALMFDLGRVVYKARRRSIPATMDRNEFVVRAVLTFLAGGDR